MTPEEMHDKLFSGLTILQQIDLIDEVQQEAYNQAIDDAIKNAKTKVITTKKIEGAEFRAVIVDKESILKLKK